MNDDNTTKDDIEAAGIRAASEDDNTESAPTDAAKSPADVVAECILAGLLPGLAVALHEAIRSAVDKAFANLLAPIDNSPGTSPLEGDPEPREPRTTIDDEAVATAVDMVAKGDAKSVAPNVLLAAKRRGLVECRGRGRGAKYVVTAEGEEIVKALAELAAAEADAEADTEAT
jgi:hypothetical protein